MQCSLVVLYVIICANKYINYASKQIVNNSVHSLHNGDSFHAFDIQHVGLGRFGKIVGPRVKRSRNIK